MTYALITGASKGIGKAIAWEMAKKKVNLLLVARNEELLKKVSEELKDEFGIEVYYLVCDLARTDGPQEIYNWCLIKKYQVQFLINNAGYGLSGKFENYTLTEYMENMQVNMNAVVQLTYLFLPDLKKNGRSYILNVSSSAAYQAVPYLSVYAATKAFVLQFSRALRHEVKHSNVSITCVSPGSTETDFAQRAKVGEKGLKLAKKVNMQAKDVARIGVNAMLKGKSEVVTGIINKLGVFMAWLLPKRMIESTSAKIYE